MRFRYLVILRVTMLVTPAIIVGFAPPAATSGPTATAATPGSEPAAPPETALGTEPPAPAQSTPLVFRTSGDSVLIRFGDARQWVRLTDVPSPDTTFLGPEHDLILLSQSDSATIPRSAGIAAVRFIRTADTLSEVFLFKTKSAVEQPRYAALLRRYSRFNRAPLTTPVVFDELSAYAHQTEELRSLFPLDSIAGNGSDLSRMRNLRHWIHSRIRWDGSKENPSGSTVAEDMKACMVQGLTMNCGGLAASYAAVCRAVGLLARQIVCLPFGRQDPDCHSVVVVYSDSLQRWVYMDPTFEADWTDARGNLLDLQQARALLAEGDTVLVNRGANVNGEPRDPMDHLAYMSKNLFRFKTWPDLRTIIYLNPCGYDSTGVVPGQATDEGERRCVVTEDPAVFWAAPGMDRKGQ
jgi:hypothetical protein